MKQVPKNPVDPGPFAPLIGQIANRCWLGYGSVLRLEFGKLTAPGEVGSRKHGAWSLSSDIILWRIEQNDSVLAGSEDNRPTMQAAIDRINGREFLSGKICETTGDSFLRFTDNIVVRTFVLTADEYFRWEINQRGDGGAPIRTVLGNLGRHDKK